MGDPSFTLTRPRRTPVRQPAVAVDLLAAIFTVNRTAKRYRDKAAKHYNASQFGFATNSRHVKERMYALKDRGIACAFRQGLIHPTGSHGALTYFEGGGYRFHSLLRPVGRDIPVLSEGNIQVEAKPKGKREVRLLDAEHTLNLLPPLDTAGFERRSFPPRFHPRPHWEDDERDDFEDREEY